MKYRFYQSLLLLLLILFTSCNNMKSIRITGEGSLFNSLMEFAYQDNKSIMVMGALAQDIESFPPLPKRGYTKTQFIEMINNVPNIKIVNHTHAWEVKYLKPPQNVEMINLNSAY